MTVSPMSSRPPMGWNSWDCFGTTVTEAEVLNNARFMAEHLLPYGWDTVVIDIDWSDPTARPHGYNRDAPLVLDEYGPLAEQVHALGLRLGIHTMRGIPRRAVHLGMPIRGTHAHAGDIADPTNVCQWNPDMLGVDHTHPARAGVLRLDTRAVRGLGCGLHQGRRHALALPGRRHRGLPARDRTLRPTDPVESVART